MIMSINGSCAQKMSLTIEDVRRVGCVVDDFVSTDCITRKSRALGLHSDRVPLIIGQLDRGVSVKRDLESLFAFKTALGKRMSR